MEDQAAFFVRYLPMKITLASMKTAVLPAYLGSTLRGVIGQALHHDIDAYNYLYNNRTLNSNQQDIVNPYIIIPPAVKEYHYLTGEELTFHMYLFGDAIQYTPAVIQALGELQSLGLGASRYPFHLLKVTHDLDQRVIWQDGFFNKIAIRSIVLPFESLPAVTQMSIRTRTPLRIRRKGELLKTIDFPTVVRNAVQRIDAITTRYGGWTDKAEMERIRTLSTGITIVREHLELKNMTRYSNRLAAKMDLSGLMGDICFQGDLTPFVPWLHAAQVLHIGRNTTFGMGRIEVEFL